MQEFISKQNLKAFAKFCLVGILSTLVNYSIFYALFKIADFYYLLASSLGFICGIFVSYILNRKFTFKSESQKRLIEFFKYLLVCLVSLCFSLLTLNLMVEKAHLSPLLGNLFAIGVSTVLNFTGARLIVFKAKLL
ncbi:MAG: GtrA family protein [Candidatus Doudnabacteria bacterium]|nr:GtrA family protein [Candidatus Doudnabacteria bacterium]